MPSFHILFTWMVLMKKTSPTVLLAFKVGGCGKHDGSETGGGGIDSQCFSTFFCPGPTTKLFKIFWSRSCNLSFFHQQIASRNLNFWSRSDLLLVLVTGRVLAVGNLWVGNLCYGGLVEWPIFVKLHHLRRMLL